MRNIWNFYHPDASALVALGLHALQHRGQEGCGIVSLMEKTITEKRQGLVGDHFTDFRNFKKTSGLSLLVTIDTLQQVKPH